MKTKISKETILFIVLGLIVLVLIICTCKNRNEILEHIVEKKYLGVETFENIKERRIERRIERKNSIYEIVEKLSEKFTKMENNINNINKLNAKANYEAEADAGSSFTGGYIIEHFECVDYDSLIVKRNEILTLKEERNTLWTNLKVDTLNALVAQVIEDNSLKNSTTISDIAGYLLIDNDWVKQPAGTVITYNDNENEVNISEDENAIEITQSMNAHVNAKNVIQESLDDINEKILNYSPSNCSNTESFTGSINEYFSNPPPSWSGSCKYEDVLEHKLDIANKQIDEAITEYTKAQGAFDTDKENIYEDTYLEKYIKDTVPNKLLEIAVKNDLSEINTKDTIKYYFFGAKKTDGTFDIGSNEYNILSGRRLIEDTNEKTFQIKLLNLDDNGKVKTVELDDLFKEEFLQKEGNVFKKTGDKYVAKDDAPLWIHLWVVNNQFLTDESITNIKVVHNKINEIYKDKTEIEKKIREESAKDIPQKRWVPCMNLKELEDSLRNNAERFTGQYIKENFTQCKKKNILKQRLDNHKSKWNTERAEYWESRELSSLMASLTSQYKNKLDIIIDEYGLDTNDYKNAFAKLPDSHPGKKKWLQEQQRIMEKYVEMKKQFLELKDNYENTPAPTMWEDCDVQPIVEEEEITTEVCPSPSGCPAITTTIKFNEFPSVFNTSTLQSNIKTQLISILGSNLGTVTFEENKYYFTITLDKENIQSNIEDKETRTKLQTKMEDLFFSHLQGLYIASNPKQEKYNIPRERIKVFIMYGSLKIVLEILSDDYSLGPGESQTAQPEQNLTDIEEWKQFMSTFNMPGGGTENIVQYEPEGVSGIFAPYIKVI